MLTDGRNIIVLYCIVCIADINTKGTPAQPFSMPPEVAGGDVATLQLALKFLYLGCIEDPDQLGAEQLLSLVALSDYLAITSLTDTCKALIRAYVRKDVI